MKFSECLKSRGVTALWYMTHLDNLESILEKGILCKNSVQSQKVAYKDISDSVVQSRRGPAHNYVPFYFADNTPMLYNVVSADGQVVMLQVDTVAADCEGVYFSDSNVATGGMHIFDDPTQLAKLDWYIIQSRSPAWGGDWRRKRMAEVLIPSPCASSHIRIVHVQNSSVNGVRISDLATAIVDKFPPLNIRVQVDLTKRGVR